MQIANFRDQSSRYVSGHNSSGWVGYHFQKMTIIGTHYTLQSHMGPFLQTWVIEGSLDDATWFQLDAQERSTTLIHDHGVASLPIQKLVKCSKIRVRQRGPTMNPGRPPGFFALSALDVFGNLKGYAMNK